MENLMYYGCQGIITAAEKALKRECEIAHNLADYRPVPAEQNRKWLIYAIMRQKSG